MFYNYRIKEISYSKQNMFIIQIRKNWFSKWINKDYLYGSFNDTFARLSDIIKNIYISYIIELKSTSNFNIEGERYYTFKVKGTKRKS